jgi:mycothiol synthase
LIWSEIPAPPVRARYLVPEHPRRITRFDGFEGDGGAMVGLRPYRDDEDVARLHRFLQRGWQATGTAGGLFHVGDITWQRFMYTRETFRPEERIALWERADGEIAGFGWYDPKWTEVAIQLDPHLRGTDDWRRLFDAFLAWADDKRAADADATRGLSIAEFETDTAFAASIARHGFEPIDTPPMRFHHRSLRGEIPAPVLPEGFAVRPLLGEAEYAQRVEIHRQVWAPSRFTVEGYRQLRSAPGYDPELDLVAVAPDGTFGAYAICWHDEVNRSGEFEPVGAREAFRGRGLAKAVLHEGMARLKARGCTDAYVYTGEDRIPACRLYRAAGFTVVNRWIFYRKREATAQASNRRTTE